jgi:DNA polymerase III epsilon subunit-like protein
MTSRTNLVLIFDVETTGLLPKTKEQPLNQYPYILQWSFVLYNLSTCQIERQYDKYINVFIDRAPDDPVVKIDEFITTLTGITEEKCRNGVSIIDAMDVFYHAYMMADYIVAHNMQFDSQMIEIEMRRHHARIERELPYCYRIFNVDYERMRGMHRYCTMVNGTVLCNIQVPIYRDVSASSGVVKPEKFRLKWPKLAELYSKLFATPPPDDLHNSMIDVLTCLRCMLKMKFNREISDMRFDNMLRSVACV